MKVLAKPTSWVSGGEERTWGLGSGRSVTKRAIPFRASPCGYGGGHERSGVRANWSDDDDFTY